MALVTNVQKVILIDLRYDKQYIGTYLLEVPTVPTECKVCPVEKAFCNGGAFIGPRPGYWRKNNVTDDFIACFV